MFPIRDTVPSRHRPLMTWLLIGVNALVFLTQLGLPRESVRLLFYVAGVVPARLSDPEWAMSMGFHGRGWATLLTSMFLHSGFFHVASNMWTLWIFGDNVEDRMGPFRFLSFYLLSGLAAGLTHWLTNPASTIPTVGASGAIAGVLGAYLVLFPRARVLTLIPVFFYPLFLEIPALVFLGVWFASQLFSGTLALAGPGEVGGVAWWAHVGGFVAGIVLYRLFLRSDREPPAEPPRHLVMLSPPPSGHWR